MSKTVIVIGIAALLAAVYYFQSAQSAPAPAPASAGPPANAEFFPDAPESLIGPASASRAAARRGQPSPAEEFIGMWVPESGWEGEVTEVTAEHTRLRRYSTAVVGGELSIVAHMPMPEGVEKGRIVRVQGRISNIRVKAAAAQVFNIIDLDDARMVR